MDSHECMVTQLLKCARCPARALHRYFAASKVLARQYWTGLFRNGSYALYAQPDLSYVPQAASNDPYAHWWVRTSRRCSFGCELEAQHD